MTGDPNSYDSAKGIQSVSAAKRFEDRFEEVQNHTLGQLARVDRWPAWRGWLVGLAIGCLAGSPLVFSRKPEMLGFVLVGLALAAVLRVGVSPTRDRVSPFRWISTAYFTMGAVYALVTHVSLIIFTRLGVGSERATLYSGLLQAPYVLKIWAPLLESGDKKKWVWRVQIALFASLSLALAPALGFSSVVAVLVVMMLAAILGATQDMACDGLYVNTLRPAVQARLAGWQGFFWNLGPIVIGGPIVQFAAAIPRRPEQSYAASWAVVAMLLGPGLLVFALWHRAVLPESPWHEVQVAQPRSDVGNVVREFFAKPRIWRMLLFVVFYRASVGFLERMAWVFFIEPAKGGHGLGFDNWQLGNVGWLWTVLFVAGTILGGHVVARFTLRRTLWLLCAMMNASNVVFIYLASAAARPGESPSPFLLFGLVAIQRFGFGLGAVGHIVYMMQEMARGRYKTAHYAFATGLMAFCMMLTGAVSGEIHKLMGGDYVAFFTAVAVLGGILSLVVTFQAPFQSGEPSPVRYPPVR